jgi:hypothetical protein
MAPPGCNSRAMRILPIAPAALALLLAGCGGGTTTTTTGASSAASQNPVKAAFAFARCMRQHGLPNFPDPKVHVSGSGGEQSIAVGFSAGVGASPRFKTAQRACRGVLPGPTQISPAEQHTRAVKLLGFARCMRAHGVSGFPDPTSAGEITQEMLASARINVRAPFVQKAAYACVPAAGGAITAAQIQAAIAHGG